MEYQVGEYLIHETSGLCHVDDIADMELMGKGSKKTYYCMSSVYREGAKVYTPIEGSSVRLRHVASAECFRNILTNMRDLALIEETNDRLRQEKFKEIMGEFTPESLARVVKTVLLRQRARQAAGKKVMAADEKTLATAGRKLYEEMAFSMGKDIAEVQELFAKAVKADSQLETI